jgi:hypothetical protein
MLDGLPTGQNNDARCVAAHANDVQKFSTAVTEGTHAHPEEVSAARALRALISVTCATSRFGYAELTQSFGLGLLDYPNSFLCGVATLAGPGVPSPDSFYVVTRGFVLQDALTACDLHLTVSSVQFGRARQVVRVRS